MAGVPGEITGDALWKLEVYRRALFLGDLAWHDALKLREERWFELADQLYGASGSVSANIAEGYGRLTSKDRTRFHAIALGSAREARDWYFKSRHILGEAVTAHRLALLAQLIRQLLRFLSHSGRHFHETAADYTTSPDPPPSP